ncbi:MAG: hypothetical protein LUD72_09690, partial [Bacteroidales bacterium]|nr:hypothetical protein [Bacteroidales bacterium]
GVHYHLVAFIMHATAYAAQLKEATQEPTQETAKGTTQETTRKNQGNGNGQQVGTRKITSVQRAILDFVAQNPNARREEIAEGVGNITVYGIKYNIAVLQKMGVLRRVGSKKDGQWEVLLDENKEGTSQ